jgi:hypothetical protein
MLAVCKYNVSVALYLERHESEIILRAQCIAFHVQCAPCHHGMAPSAVAVVEEPTDMTGICE